jgi:ketopantoate reductase
MGATAEIAEDMLQAALLKLARVSTASGAMVHYNATVGEILEDPEMLDFMVSLCREMIAIADAAGCPFPPDFDAVEHLLSTARAINPNYKTSLMYDYLAGTTTEAETVFHEPYLLGRRLGLEMRAYAQVCQKFGYAV